MKFDNYELKLLKREKVISVRKNSVEKKKIPVDTFYEKGIMLLPKELKTKVQRHIRYANLYDKLLDQIDLEYK